MTWFFQVFVQQWALSVHSFFQGIINHGDFELDKTFHAHPLFQSFLREFMNEIYLVVDDDLDTLAIVVSTLEAIAAELNNGDSKRDFLFYTTSFYAKSLVAGLFRPRHPTIQTAVSGLVGALGNYRTHIGSGNPSLAKILDIPDFSDEAWWQFLESKVANSVHPSETPFAKEKDPLCEPTSTIAASTELVKHTDTETDPQLSALT